MAPELSRQDYVLAVLASVGDASFEPVHVQKLFFLLDKRVGAQLGGACFDFQPYDYGPFDRHVYDELDALRESGELVVDTDWRGLRHYHLTATGVARGEELLTSLGEDVQAEITKYAAWVQGKSFVSLVSAIYEAFPEMKVNSVFSD